MLTFFLLRDRVMLDRWSMSLVSEASARRAVGRAMRDVRTNVARYLLAITAVNLGLGVCVAVAFQLLGVSNAPLWGVAAALLNYMPFIGIAPAGAGHAGGRDRLFRGSDHRFRALRRDRGTESCRGPDRHADGGRRAHPDRSDRRLRGDCLRGLAVVRRRCAGRDADADRRGRLCRAAKRRRAPVITVDPGRKPPERPPAALAAARIGSARRQARYRMWRGGAR